MKAIRKIFMCETGATAVEIGLLCALIAMSLMVSIKSMGDSLSDVFLDISEAVSHVH